LIIYVRCQIIVKKTKYEWVLDMIIVGVVVIKLVALMLIVFPFVTRKAIAKNKSVPKSLLIAVFVYMSCWAVFYALNWGSVITGTELLFSLTIGLCLALFASFYYINAHKVKIKNT